MIDPREFLAELTASGVAAYFGVPDSLLKSFCATVSSSRECEHLIAANEGGAVALGAGYYLATGGIPLIYMQNSGIGNAINPLLSLADTEVYAIPMVLLIGWRGEPGIADEPQHKKQGAVTISLLDALEIPHRVLAADTSHWRELVRESVNTARERSAPVAIVVRKGTFLQPKELPTNGAKLPMSRESAITSILETLPADTVYIGSTGEISRELYELRVLRGEPAGKDFLTVGSMGHSSQIAAEIARQLPERSVCVLDGDGSAIMHLGGLAINGVHCAKNLCHILLNNGAHGSVGGQETVGFDINFPQIASACGYRAASCVSNDRELREALRGIITKEGPSFLEIQVSLGARADLGRPKTSPQENKEEFIRGIREPQQVLLTSLTELQSHFDAASRVLIVTSPTVRKSPEVSAFIESVGRTNESRTAVFAERIPTLEALLTLTKVFKPFAPTLIIAIGGGTVIDAGKFLSTFLRSSSPSLTRESIRTANLDSVDFVPLAAVPTTAGSGSESTPFAVYYDGVKKYSLESHKLRPYCAVLDSTLTGSLSPRQTAISGMDAICQAIESLWARGATRVSKRLARTALAELVPSYLDAIHNPTAAARESMVRGSNLAGQAIAISKTTAAHAFSYTLTTQYGVPHGAAVGICMRAILPLTLPKIDQEIQRDLEKVFGVSSIDEVVERFSELLSKSGLESSLSELSVGEALGKVVSQAEQSSLIVNQLLSEVNQERLSNHPHIIAEKELRIQLLLSPVLSSVLSPALSSTSAASGGQV